MEHKDKDPNYLAKIEYLIEQKYGKQAVSDIRASWTEEQEQAYLEQIKQIAKNQDNLPKEQQYKINDILVFSKLFKRRNEERVCPQCNTYSFKAKDDIYLLKFKCCYKCYVSKYEWKEIQQGSLKNGNKE